MRTVDQNQQQGQTSVTTQTQVSDTNSLRQAIDLHELNPEEKLQYLQIWAGKMDYDRRGGKSA